MTAHTFAIRPAERTDADAIVALLTSAELPTTGVREILERAAHDFQVAQANESGAIVGVAGIEVCCDDALLRSVAVLPEWRSAGVGRELVNQTIGAADARGFRAMYLLTLTAERYFPRFGFERIERDAVPAAVAETAEFSSVCPASATVMRRLG